MKFIATRENPFHFSCKTLIVDGNKALIVHAKDYKFSNGMGLGEFYSLVRETMEENETVDQTLTRGAAEELGVTVEPQFIIGSGEFTFEEGIGNRDYKWTKSCLYAISKFVAQDQQDRVKGEDTQHELCWVDLHEVPSYLRMFDPFGGELEQDATVIERWLQTIS